jgi:flagellar hook-basal body complex protein FliE
MGLVFSMPEPTREKMAADLGMSFAESMNLSKSELAEQHKAAGEAAAQLAVEQNSEQNGGTNANIPTTIESEESPEDNERRNAILAAGESDYRTARDLTTLARRIFEIGKLWDIDRDNGFADNNPYDPNIDYPDGYGINDRKYGEETIYEDPQAIAEVVHEWQDKSAPGQEISMKELLEEMKRRINDLDQAAKDKMRAAKEKYDVDAELKPILEEIEARKDSLNPEAALAEIS